MTTKKPNDLVCDGSLIVRADYPGLFAILGAIYSVADSTHFNVPDHRGYFPRDVDTPSYDSGKI